MSLNWDATKVEGYDSLTDDECVTRDSLIWATMAVGMNTITPENANEFFARVSFWEKVHGTYRFNNKGPLFLTREDVYRFYGLHTNATPLTETAFHKNAWESYRRFVR